MNNFVRAQKINGNIYETLEVPTPKKNNKLVNLFFLLLECLTNYFFFLDEIKVRFFFILIESKDN